MDSIKSKFRKDTLYVLIPLSLFVITICIVLSINGAIKLLNDQDISNLFLGVLLFIVLPVFYYDTILVCANSKNISQITSNKAFISAYSLHHHHL
jgi:hypothetical protein